MRTSLLILLDVAPADVLAVMADDCKGSEEETGASRRNILDFIEQQARTFREEKLESGKDLDAEEAFREGFYLALASCESTEKKQILGMILPLSTVSGKNSTAERSGEYARYLTESLSARASSNSTTPYIKLFTAFLDRNPPLDPRFIFDFLAAHGGVVVSLAFEKADKMAIALLHRLRSATVSIIKNIGEPAVKSVIPAYSKAVLDELLVCSPAGLLLMTGHTIQEYRQVSIHPRNPFSCSLSPSSRRWTAQRHLEIDRREKIIDPSGRCRRRVSRALARE